MKKLTILIAALALVCFSVPAMAVDWNFYGNARMATFYVSDDFGDGENEAGTDDSDTDLQWDMQTNSRIGATVKAESISARVELAMKGSDGGDVDVGTRRMVATWDFGAGKLKIGKDYTPTNQFISGQVFDGDAGLLGLGAFYARRPGQIELQFGAFKVALVSNSTDGGSGGLLSNMTADGTGNGDVDRVVPKLELGWGMAFDTWNFNLMGGAQYYSIEDVATQPAVDNNTEDIDVTSWVFGGDVGWNFGPGYLKAAASYSQNAGNASWTGGSAIWDGDDDTNDTTTAMGSIVGGFKVSDMLSFEGGFGIRADATDGDGDSGTLQRNTTPWAAYVQSVIMLAPGVALIPEVGYYDLDNNATGGDAGSLFYLGAKWQINF
jgi:hypothetical protein